MTDRPIDPPANELELLIAAYVDGEATPDEQARVEGDPALLALVARHRAAKAAVADVRPLSSARLDSLLAAALAEHATRRSSADGANDAAAAAAPVHPIPSPAGPSHRSLRWLGAAAAIVAVLAGFAALASVLGNGDDDDAGGAEATVEQNDGGDSADTTGGGTDSDDNQFDTGSRAGDEAQPPAAQEELPDVAGAPGTTTAAEATTAGGATDTTRATAASTPGTAAETAGDGQRSTPPDDGGTLVRLWRGSDLLDWYDRVASGDLVPPGAGSRACGKTILGWAEVGQGDQFVVVARRPGNRIVALDVETNCSRLFIAQVD
jgi:hypothetical protein